jgi:hypothetical protein
MNQKPNSSRGAFYSLLLVAFGILMFFPSVFFYFSLRGFSLEPWMYLLDYPAVCLILLGVVRWFLCRREKSGSKHIKGWSLLNIVDGLISVIIGSSILIAGVIWGFLVAGDSDKPLPFYFWLIEVAGIAMVALGVLGFWFVIPAFQKWGRAQPGLAWICLAIAIVVVSFGLIFWKII